MNSIQYAMARAAYEAYNEEALLEALVKPFDDCHPREQRLWLAAAKAAVETL